MPNLLDNSSSRKVQTEFFAFELQEHTPLAKYRGRIYYILKKSVALSKDIFFRSIFLLEKATEIVACLPLFFINQKFSPLFIKKIAEANLHLKLLAFYIVDFVKQPYHNLIQPEIYIDTLFININAQLGKDENSLLLLALGEHKFETAIKLMEKGANLYTLNRAGITPYYVLKANKGYFESSKGESKIFHDLFMKIKHAKSSSSEKKFRQLKMFGHISHLKGFFRFKKKNNYSFEGLSPNLSVEYLTKSIFLFARKFHSLISPLTLNIFYSTLKHCMDSNSSILFKKYNNQAPIIIYGGYQQHTWFVVMWDGYLILCNKNGTLNDLSLSYKINTKDDKEITELIQNIKNCSRKTKKESVDYFRSLIKNKTILETTSASEKFVFPAQKVENCTYYNLELALSCLWQLAYIKEQEKLHHLSEMAFLPLTVINNYKSIVDKKLKIFQIFQFHHYLTQLPKFLNKVTKFEKKNFQYLFNHFKEWETVYPDLLLMGHYNLLNEIEEFREKITLACHKTELVNSTHK